jgi:hypothetical protein
VPGIDLAAGTARRAGTLTASSVIRAALDNGTAVPVPGIRDTLFFEGRWLAPAASGWTEIPAPERAGLPAPADAGPSPSPASAASEGGQPDPWTTT